MIGIIIYFIIGLFFAVLVYKKCELSEESDFFENIYNEGFAYILFIVILFLYPIAIPGYFIVLLFNKLAVKILTKQNKPN